LEHLRALNVGEQKPVLEVETSSAIRQQLKRETASRRGRIPSLLGNCGLANCAYFTKWVKPNVLFGVKDRNVVRIGGEVIEL
jgi:hypothetical protein